MVLIARVRKKTKFYLVMKKKEILRLVRICTSEKPVNEEKLEKNKK